MADSSAMTRETLFQTLCEHWQHTEDAIAAAGEHFDKSGYDGWTVGDIFRHLTSIAHDTASQVREMIATGEHILSTAEENEAGVERFRTLDCKMLRIELNTAHGVVWMYIQRFSDEDLAQRYKMGDGDIGLGELLGLLGQHESWHMADALKAAGLDESAVVPLETAHRWA